MWIELFGFAFSAFALSRVFLRFREGRVSWGMMVLWSVTWISIIAYIVSPKSFEVVSRAIGIQRPLDFMFIIGLVFSYYITFRVYVYLEELRQDMAKVVREVAIREKK